MSEFLELTLKNVITWYLLSYGLNIFIFWANNRLISKGIASGSKFKIGESLGFALYSVIVPIGVIYVYISSRGFWNKDL